jgi:hypothetical protein
MLASREDLDLLPKDSDEEVEDVEDVSLERELFTEKDMLSSLSVMSRDKLLLSTDRSAHGPSE